MFGLFKKSKEKDVIVEITAHLNDLKETQLINYMIFKGSNDKEDLYYIQTTAHDIGLRSFFTCFKTKISVPYHRISEIHYKVIRE